MAQQLIINFHGIGSPHSGVDASEKPYWMSAENMSRIFKRVADIKSDLRRSSSLPEILITFDDGNRSDLTLALPELVKNGLTAKFFVCAGRMSDPNYLDKAAIRELQSAGMGIGNHGRSQRNLTTLSYAELEDEISTAGDELSQITGQDCSEVALPFGAYNRKVLKWLQSKRLSCIYTSDRGTTDSALRIKARESITGQMANMAMPDLLLEGRTLPKYLRRKVVTTIKRWR